ncbi:MAG TPA: hypothetical protein VLV83_07520 [Acidobacteriota bacterium]|nr:hypothetical protein [Acidobacteriota bacterium]
MSETKEQPKKEEKKPERAVSTGIKPGQASAQISRRPLKGMGAIRGLGRL